MKRENLKIALRDHYDSTATINSILRGIRRPNYEVIIKLNHSHSVPFEAWRDIKLYLQEHDTKQPAQQTSATHTRKAS